MHGHTTTNACQTLLVAALNAKLERVENVDTTDEKGVHCPLLTLFLSAIAPLRF